MRFLLDTNVFNNRKFLEWIREHGDEFYVSAVSAMELVYHHLKKGMPEGYTLSVLKAIGIKIADFGYEAALQGAKSAIEKWDFGERAPDYAVLGAAKALDAVLVTQDKGQFAYEKVKTPGEVMNG
jgi:hypothetical protein